MILSDRDWMRRNMEELYRLIEEKIKKVEVKEDACCDSDERSPITKEVKGNLPPLPGENE